MQLRVTMYWLFLCAVTACPQQPNLPSSASDSRVTAQPASPHLEFPETVQKNMDLGMVAVDKQDWTMAIHYFAEAQQIRPYSAPILFNLGLAHARAGHELAAMAWLHAYLVSVPNAQNRKEVRNQIDKLKLSAEVERDKIFQGAIRAAGEIKDEKERGRALSFIYENQAVATGDIDRAMKALGFNSAAEDSVDRRNRFLLQFANLFADIGDVQGARDALAHIVLPPQSRESLASLEKREAAIESTITDIEKRNANLERQGKDDQANYDQIHQLNIQSWELHDTIRVRKNLMLLLTGEIRCLEELGDAGDLDRAEELARTVDKEGDPDLTPDWNGISGHRANQAHSILLSNKLATALDLAHGLRLSKDRASALEEISWKLLENNDQKGAMTLAREILALGPPEPQVGLPKEGIPVAHPSINSIEYDSAAVAQAILGDYDAAVSLAGKVELNLIYPINRTTVFGKIAYLQALAGDVVGAQRTALVADSQPEGIKNHAPENYIVRALLQKGQIAQALAIAKEISVEAHKDSTSLSVGSEGNTAWYSKASALRDIGKTQILAGDEVSARNTIRLMRMVTIPDDLDKLEILMPLADAYLLKGLLLEARRILAEAAALNIDRNKWNVDSFEKLAKLQERSGDREGAIATRESVPSAQLISWLDLAAEISRDPSAVDTDTSIQKAIGASRPEDIVRGIAVVGEFYGRRLLQLRVLEKKLGDGQ